MGGSSVQFQGMLLKLWTYLLGEGVVVGVGVGDAVKVSGLSCSWCMMCCVVVLLRQCKAFGVGLV